MAVTPVGNPYVESSDNVADYPGASEALAERIDIVGVNPFANAAARDLAIPSPVQGQMCSLNDDNKGYRYDGSAWVLFSGAGDANFTNAASGDYVSGGISYKWVQFLASGELIVDQAGFADILIIGGGAGGGGTSATQGAGGGGGGVLATSAYLPVGTLTVVVGAGGAGGNAAKMSGQGLTSSVHNYFSIGGGNCDDNRAGGFGGSGGGGTGSNAGGPGISGLGNNGGASVSNSNGGGGGGSGAVGGAGSGVNGGGGGAGSSSSITNVAVIRAGGGGGCGDSTGGAGGSGGGGAGANNSAGGSAGTVNTGGGGGAKNSVGLAGGSGLVIVRVVV